MNFQAVYRGKDKNIFTFVAEIELCEKK